MADRAIRAADGKWVAGSSGNPGGLSREEAEKIGRVRRALQKRSMKAVRTLDRLMDDENGKVAATAALGVLKGAGMFSDDALIERKVNERLQEMLEAAERKVPALAAVG